MLSVEMLKLGYHMIRSHDLSIVWGAEGEFIHVVMLTWLVCPWRFAGFFVFFYVRLGLDFLEAYLSGPAEYEKTLSPSVFGNVFLCYFM